MRDTIPRTPLSDRQIVASLRSAVCPACGRVKKTAQSLCYSCYQRLSPAQRVALYDDLGNGYDDAIEAAFDRLGVVTPHLPAAVEVSRGG